MRYVDDKVGAASSNKKGLSDFAIFLTSDVYSSLKLSWLICDNKLPFLDLT